MSNCKSIGTKGPFVPNIHPIQFTAAMSAALPCGKTRTSRKCASPFWSICDSLSRKQMKGINWSSPDVEICHSPGLYERGDSYIKAPGPDNDSTRHRLFCRVKPGDILYVKEPWYVDLVNPPTVEAAKEHLYYRSDGDCCDQIPECQCKFPEVGKPKWRQPMFMPKWACRRFLRVAIVFPQRIQDISMEDIQAEGIGEETACPVRSDGMHSDNWYDGESCEACGAASLTEEFQTLWNTIHKPPFSFLHNPLVWAISFEPCEAPKGWPNA